MDGNGTVGARARPAAHHGPPPRRGGGAQRHQGGGGRRRHASDPVRLLVRELEAAEGRSAVSHGPAALLSAAQRGGAARRRHPPFGHRRARRAAGRYRRPDRGGRAADARQCRPASDHRPQLRRPCRHRRGGAPAGRAGRRPACWRRRRSTRPRSARISPPWAARPGPDDPHQRRAARQQFPAVAAGLRGNDVCREVLAGFRRRGSMAALAEFRRRDRRFGAIMADVLPGAAIRNRSHS